MSDEQLIVMTKYFYIYLGFLAGIIGSIGNILNIITLIGLKKYRTLPSSMFLAGSSFGEQLTIISLIFPQSFASATGYDIRGLSSIVCKLSSFLFNGGGVLSLSCLYSAAAERYLQTCRSATKRQWLTVKKAQLLFLICIVLSGITGAAFGIFRDRLPTADVCDYIDAGFVQFAFSFYSVMGTIAPLILFFGFAFLTWRNLRQTRERQLINQNASHLTQQVTRLILLQAGTIIISIFPGALINLYGILFRKDTLMATPIEIFILCITQILTYTNSCTSFYLYVALSKTFRQNVKYALCSKFMGENRVSQLTQTRSVHSRRTSNPNRN